MLTKILEEMREKATELKNIHFVTNKGHLVEKGIEIMCSQAEDIIRKHMKDDKCGECSRRKWYQKGYKDGKKDNDGWIPCDERLPEVDEDIEETIEDDECPEYNVTIKGASEATTLKYSPDGTWFDENGCTYDVIAWRPLPESYRPEKGAEE